jgi:hypothetical protein
MKKSKSPLRLAIAFDALGAAISDLQASITQSTSPEEVYRSKREEELTLVGAPGEAVLESPQEGIEKEIDAIFVKTPKKKIKVEDLDTFWEEVTSGTTFSDSTSPGLLTYEQASKLGLTPSDKEL